MPSPRDAYRLLLLALFPPVFAVFLMALVRIALSVPHPPVQGIGFPLALAGLLTASAALSVATLRAVAEAGAFLRRPRVV